jgi:hypothetical protein
MEREFAKAFLVSGRCFCRQASGLGGFDVMRNWLPHLQI